MASDVLRPTQAPVIGLLPGTRPRDLLVVHASRQTQRLLAGTLESVGFITRIAATVDDASACAVTDPPDIILLGWQVAGVEGADAMASLRALPDMAQVPIVIISVSGEDEVRDAALRAGAADFLLLPVREAQLFATIARHTDVAFAFADSHVAVSVETEADALDNVAISGLPVELVSALHEAVQAGDLLAIDELVARASTIDTVAGKRLGKLAEAFDYPALLALLEQ